MHQQSADPRQVDLFLPAPYTLDSQGNDPDDVLLVFDDDSRAWLGVATLKAERDELFRGYQLLHLLRCCG